MPSVRGQTCPAFLWNSGSQARSEAGYGSIGENEQALSRADQPKFAAGDFFDCVRVVAQACGLEGESAVLFLEPGDGVAQLLPFVAHSDGLNESSITGHAVRYDDRERQADGHEHDAAHGRWRRIGGRHLPCLVLARGAERERPLRGARSSG
jgi:hypothetical protein